MNCQACISSSRTALRRVFLASPVEQPATSQLRYLLAPSLHARQWQYTPSTHRLFTGIRRTITRGPDEPPSPPPLNPRDPVTHPSEQGPTRDSRSVRAHNRKKGAAAGPPALPRDEEIRRIADHVVLRREDGLLTEPRPLSAVLTEASIRDQTVVTIVVPRPGQTKGSRYPICVVLDRRAYEEGEARRAAEEREKALGERKAKKGMKELEINWAIDKHDLEHKMKKFREFLGKGLRVDVLLLRRPRKKGRQATEEEVEETLRKVREEAASVAGTREYKGASGVIGERYQLYFEGPQR
ncbi:hypothetical protein NKR19_g7170 [Coniochaeta hoffmannii]|uniref:Translation initiation factor IF-3 n=1 Tax=Coniochaeta hoffmannii TaxID=91930 RepID=A0AA38VH43_9PEZI|nr:hypothetical protein NKR19_g7170 [Coniochaeta hoffmannii]